MKTSLLQFLKVGLLAGLVAAIINAILFFIFRQTGVITDAVLLPNNEPMTVVPIVLSSLIPSVLASLVYYLLTRFTKDGFRYFTILALTLLVLSFANPFLGIPNVPVAYALALCTMHVIVVATLLFAFKKYTLSSYNYE